MITLNVIYTPGTPGRLLPFTLSLLQGSGVRIRIVENGCPPEESRLLRAAAEVDDRITYYSLGVPGPVEHGLALNHLFERFTEPCFGMVDSDMIASGDYMSGIPSLFPGKAAVFSGSPVWAADNDMVVRKSCTWIGARHRILTDGTSVGNSYFAIYDRALLEPAWRAAPRGFGTHDRYQLSRSVQKAFAERGWRYVMFDTARVLNLQLILDGHALEHLILPTLHHVGGFSAENFARRKDDLAALAGATFRILRSDDGRRVQRFVDGARHRLFLTRSRRDPRHVRMNAHRRLVISHIREVVDAIRSGETPPETPITGLPDVDSHVAALVGAIEDRYPIGLAASARTSAQVSSQR